MNKTININLSSVFFYVNESAYLLLTSYITKLEKAFDETEGKDEILADVEARIAELFQEKKVHTNYVINEDDVTAVINILGQPEDFLSKEDDDLLEETKYTSKKKLFRDPDNKYIGGVASGFKYYFGIDSRLIRVIWIILALFSIGSFGFIYLLMWFLIPVAKTTSDILEMKGKPINVDTIQEKIKKEFDEISSKIKEVDYQKTADTLKRKSKLIFDFIERLLSLIPNAIFKLMGVFLLIISTFSILGTLIGSVVFLIFGIQYWPFNIYFNFINFNLLPSISITITIFLLIIIPFIFLFSLGIRLLYSKTSSFGTVGRTVLFFLWIIALVSLLVTGIRELKNQSVTATKIETKMLMVAAGDTLILKTNSLSKGKENQEWEFDRSTVIKDAFNEEWGIGENLKIYVNQGGLKPSYFELKFSANGTDYEHAQGNAEKIIYGWQQNKKLLSIDPLWKLETKTNFYNQKLKLNLFLQEGQILFIDPTIKNMIQITIDNNGGYRQSEMDGHYWKMIDGILNCIDCKENQAELNIQYHNEKGKEKIDLNIDNQGLTVKIK